MKKNTVRNSLKPGKKQHANSVLCFVAGKSGGHIVPALTIAQQHKEQFPDDKILFFSTMSRLDTLLLSSCSLVDYYRPLNLDNVPRSVVRLPMFLLSSFRAFFTSFSQLRTHKPTRVISMGGYISIPVCLAAWLLRIPVELYELNAVPGKATRALAPFARTIAVCFDGTQRYFNAKKVCFKPYPVRFTHHDKHKNKTHLLMQLGLQTARKTILVLGGSQGSSFINTLIKQWVEQYPTLHHQIQIIHQTGAHETTPWASFYATRNIPAIVFDYHHAMQNYYVVADTVFCRSGAGTLWEAAFFGKRTLTIPLETKTTDHQIENAKAMITQFPTFYSMLEQHNIQKHPTQAFTAIMTILFDKQSSNT